MRILSYIVSDEDEGRAVRSVVPRRFHLGAHAFRRLKAMELIFVAGQSVRASRILHAGEIVEIHLPDEGAESVQLTEPAESSSSALPSSFIRYMDDDLIVVSKGAPLATLPDAHTKTGTLREQLACMLCVPEDQFIYHPVNRLDKGTSGLLVVARHAHAQRLLGLSLHSGAFVREYYAVTEGVPAQMQGTISAPIAHPSPGAKRIVREDGKPAVTHYRVEQISGNRALLRLRLETGRTHQIRVHLSHLGYPIVGDYLYGQESAALPGRFALHSCYLQCIQPITRETIELNEPLPDALQSLL